MALAGWREADPALLVEESVTAIVQINGKVRDRLEVAPDIDAAQLEALARALPSVDKHIGAGEIRTVVVRAPRLVNFVVK